MSSELDEIELAEELLRRRTARKGLADFSRYLFPDEPPASHHQLICDAWDEIISGIENNLPIEDRLRRVMFFMPPGSAKSTYSSVRGPAYFLGRLPTKSIICGSYSENLSTSFGRKVRNTLLDKNYLNLFDTTLSEDSRAKGEWETNHGGSYFACGIGTGVTGRRADVGVIDDPVKGRKDADSETIRNDTWDWFTADFFSRLKPKGAMVVIQTRWHEDDLSGRILPSDWNGESGDFKGFDGQLWRVICLPAQARENDILGRKPGDWLWTDWFTEKYWEETRQIQTAKDIRNWNSLYQQIPQPEQGVFFQRDWFKRYTLGEEPALTKYGCSDYAVTDGGGDFTEHGVGGFDRYEDLYFVDWWSGQTTADEWFKSQFKLVRRHNIYIWVAEVGTIRRSVEPFLKKAQRDGIETPEGKLRAYFKQEWLPHIGDKAANARAFQALAAAGKVYIPRCEWGDELIDQLVRFIPNTNFRDDKVDVCGLFGRILDQSFGPTQVQVEEKQQSDSYGFDDEEKSWKLA